MSKQVARRDVVALDVSLTIRPIITTITMADATTEIDLDSVIDRLLEGESSLLSKVIHLGCG
jgi:hypothetical protein